MGDPRNNRKRPRWHQVSANFSFHMTQRPIAYVSLGNEGADLDRSDARKLRDWLNHYIEWAAEHD